MEHATKLRVMRIIGWLVFAATAAGACVASQDMLYNGTIRLGKELACAAVLGSLSIVVLVLLLRRKPTRR